MRHQHRQSVIRLEGPSEAIESACRCQRITNICFIQTHLDGHLVHLGTWGSADAGIVLGSITTEVPDLFLTGSGSGSSSD